MTEQQEPQAPQEPEQPDETTEDTAPEDDDGETDTKGGEA